MATIINNPPTEGSGNNLGMLFGVIVILVLGYLFIFYGLPMLRQVGTPQITVPSEIDVNVNQTE